MKKDTTLKDVFSASMNLQMSSVGKDSDEQFRKVIGHNQKTVGILLSSGIPLFAICIFLMDKYELNLFRYIPWVLFLFLYAQYKDLHKQALLGIKKLNMKANQRVDLTR